MSKLTDKICELARPVCENNGCELWDVEFVKEAGTRYLRVYLDKPGGVSIDDCENVSRELDPILDEADPIAESYVFEVSSAGAERELKRPGDFERFIGETVEVKLYTPYKGSKSHIGELRSYDNGDVTVSSNGEDITFSKSAIALVRLRIV
jgi:ribosome maturation factor RimP